MILIVIKIDKKQYVAVVLTPLHEVHSVQRIWSDTQVFMPSFLEAALVLPSVAYWLNKDDVSTNLPKDLQKAISNVNLIPSNRLG